MPIALKRTQTKPKNNGKITYIGKSGTEYYVMSGCIVCNGVIFPYTSNTSIDSFMEKLGQCFQCGRLYVPTRRGYELWIVPLVIRKHKEKTPVEEIIGGIK